MTDRESHYKETLFKTKEQPVATTNQEEREVLYTDATGTYKLVPNSYKDSCKTCDRRGVGNCPKVDERLICVTEAVTSVGYVPHRFVKLND